MIFLLAVAKIIFLILLVVLCLILSLLLVLVLVPFYFHGRFKRDEEYEGEIDVKWLWGALGLELNLSGKKKLVILRLFNLKIFSFAFKPKSGEVREEKALKKSEKKTKKKERKKEKEPSFGEQLERVADAVQMLSIDAFKEVMVCLKRLFHSLRVRISGAAEVGLSDPADMGALLGFFYSISGIFGITSFELIPNWDQKVLKARAELQLRIWLAEILMIAAKTIFSGPIRRIWWPLIREKLRLVRLLGRVRPQTTGQ